MIYKWKMPGLMPVKAQTAGEELDRIYQKNGRLDAADVVDESRPITAPLHDCFEWNDAIAAEEYRKSQASHIIRSITVVPETVNGKQDARITRAFVNVQQTFRPIDVVMNDENMRRELMEKALRDLDAFQKKYASLEALQPVFDATRTVAAKYRRTQVHQEQKSVSLSMDDEFDV